MIAKIISNFEHVQQFISQKAYIHLINVSNQQ